MPTIVDNGRKCMRDVTGYVWEDGRLIFGLNIVGVEPCVGRLQCEDLEKHASVFRIVSSISILPQAMPTRPHFRNPQLTVKMDMDSSGEFMMNIEDTILKTLGNHPRIVTYHGRDDATGALILSTAPNGDVQHYLHDHSDTPLRIRAKWGLQLAEGIVYLHSKHIVWADCNPSNLLLTSDLDILLCDFAGSSMFGLRPFVCPGTAYSLPKLEWSADANMDIFSFGSVFFEILTLQPPYAGLDADDIQAKYDSSVFPDIPSHIPDGLAAVIQNCWHLKYQSSKELFDDMERAYNAMS